MDELQKKEGRKDYVFLLSNALYQPSKDTCIAKPSVADVSRVFRWDSRSRDSRDPSVQGTEPHYIEDKLDRRLIGWSWSISVDLGKIDQSGAS